MSRTPKNPRPKTPKTVTKAKAKAKDKLRGLMYEKLNLYPPDRQRKYRQVETRHDVTITRELAQEMFEGRFSGQREISDTHVKTLAAKMLAGAWRSTAQGLIIDWYGRLIDGQHRLAAFLSLREEDVPTITMTITRGCDPVDFIDLDQDSSPRKIKDLLSTGDMPRSAAASTAFRACLDYIDTHEGRATATEGAKKGHISFGHRTSSKFRVDRHQIVEWILQHQDLLEDITDTTKPKNMPRFLRPASFFSGFYLWVALDNRAKADEFFDALISGARLEKNSPILMLRRAFEKFDREVGAKTEGFVRGGIIIKAWNAFITGKTIDKLTMTAKEPWPHREGAKKFEW